MVISAVGHPAWCDLAECDADPGIGRGCHRARPMAMPYDEQSRSSGSVLMVSSPGRAHTWICIDLRSVDVQGDPAEEHVPSSVELGWRPVTVRPRCWSDCGVRV